MIATGVGGENNSKWLPEAVTLNDGLMDILDGVVMAQFKTHMLMLSMMF